MAESIVLQVGQRPVRRPVVRKRRSAPAGSVQIEVAEPGSAVLPYEIGTPGDFIQKFRAAYHLKQVA